MTIIIHHKSSKLILQQLLEERLEPWPSDMNNAWQWERGDAEKAKKKKSKINLTGVPARSLWPLCCVGTHHRSDIGPQGPG